MNLLDLIKTSVTSIPSGARWAAAGVVGTLVLVGGGTAVRSAYVYETTCRSYETDVRSVLSDTKVQGERALQIARTIDRNPYAGFGLMTEMFQIASTVEMLKTEAMDLRVDYEGACGVERVDRFFDSKEISTELSHLESLGTQLQGM